MKKRLFVVMLILFAIWMLPVKLSLPVNLGYVKNKEKENETVLLCHMEQVTGPSWYIKDSYSNVAKFSHIDIIGNVPDKYFKNPVYCYKMDFVFVGNFVNDVDPIFSVSEWKLTGFISRDFTMNGSMLGLLYPPYGINLFEIN